MLHGDQVVELSVLLGVHQEEGVEEDGEGQVEVERKEGEVKERRSWMACGWDEGRLKNILSHEVHDLSSVRFCEHLAECHVIHVLVRGRDHEGEGD